MEMVYITKSKLNNIIYQIDHATFTKDDLNHFFGQRLTKTFSHQELKTFSATKLVIESMADEDLVVTLIGRIKNDQPRKNNMSNLVFDKSTPAFHKDESCSSLRNDYENFVIPAVIPQDRYDDFRAFFKTNIEVYKRNSGAFFALAEQAFNVKIQNVKELHAPNSGCEKLVLTYNNANEVLIEIDALLSVMQDYRNQDKLTNKIVSDTTYGVRQSKNFPKYFDHIEILTQWEQYKTQMRGLIIDYLYGVFAPERRFNRDVLARLGFKECGCCFGAHQNETCKPKLGNRYSTND